MWFTLPLAVEKGTTSNSRRWNVALNLELMTGFLLVLVSGNGTDGLVLLTLLMFIVPWVSQPNRFWLPLGLQALPLLAPDVAAVHLVLKHLAEWYRSAMYLPTENGKMTLALLVLRSALTPSFSSSLPPPSLTHEPGVVTPIAARKKERVPDPVCGMNAAILPALPPTWFQLVTLHS